MTAMYYKVRHYQYKNRIGNLKSEAVGVVSGEKHFPIFPGNMIFKPLTKSKPFSTPLYAYAEVFWSTIINEYFMPAPRYELAICEGYEAVNEKYLDYGTVVPMAYKEGESLLNLLEFFRKYPDEKVDIDNYVNYCQMFYDYRDIFEADFLQEHQEMAEQLAMQVLISVLKGDQNYHYENVAFLCDKDGGIISLAPMIDHEFSTYFMFPDDISRHVYWLMELSKSIRGWEVRPGEYDNFKDPEERKLMSTLSTIQPPQHLTPPIPQHLLPLYAQTFTILTPSPILCLPQPLQKSQPSPPCLHLTDRNQKPFSDRTNSRYNLKLIR